MLTQHFFIEGRLVASAERRPILYAGQLAIPDSLLFYCRLCGDVFARAIIEDSERPAQAWQSIRCVCRKCRPRYPSMYEVPGSLWLSYDDNYLKALPGPVLEHEVKVHFEHFERLQNEPE